MQRKCGTGRYLEDGYPHQASSPFILEVLRRCRHLTEEDVAVQKHQLQARFS